ncbi:CD248 molecule, endosialin a [Clupea harengus]|uniref:CD248 molecule, endosialin a n=1 Tax=Clupea harengus TaxID=7950 RepID=A0A6P8GQV1_CLUHA|nr:CD248 molecule, endosialin a [Clupea harengus]
MGWTAVWLHCCGAALLCLLGLLPQCAVRSQDVREGDAVCTENDGCFVLYFERKTFLYAWRSCKERGGDLATLKDPRDAVAVERLFAGVDLRGKQGKVRTWIGLQRQPRQCSSTRPLRGFSWVTGDQDTRFTDWLGEDSASACTAPRCVVVGYTEPPNLGHGDNLKWTDGPCSITVDAYLCKYNYKGMCPSIPGEGGGNTFYSTPFDLLTTELSHLPYGSMATVPCPADTVGDQTVLCTDMGDGTVNWSREAPYCSVKQTWCDQDNGGCHQLCIDKDDTHVCMCIDGYVLAEDGMSCLPDDPCLNSPCESECVPVTDGFRCDCPEGYVLEPDEHSCRDLDECQQMPCEHQCINSPGSYECSCLDGYRLEGGECEDVDECTGDPCEHACENTPGSHVCHCHLGFGPTPEDSSRCQDIDECQIEDTCDHMCINYEGGFECYCQEGYELQADHYSCSLITQSHGDPTATPAYPWATMLPDSMWNLPWGPPPSVDYNPDPTDYGGNTNWMTDRPDAEEKSDQWTYQEPLVPSPSPEQSSYDPQLDPTPTPDMTTPTPSPATHESTTPDYYDDEDEDDPTATTAVPTTTFIEGAWNWLWLTSTDVPLQAGGVELGTDNCVISSTTTNSPEVFSSESYSSSRTPETVGVYGEEMDGDYEGEKTVGEGVQEKEEEEEEEEGGSWLLVGLLVPLCIFLLIMVVLGAIYCNRSASAKPQNKNTSDCYHWISGAADKAGAEHSGSATKSHV